jgi:hypothetical protein
MNISKIRVFVSSSLTELESEREISERTINSLNLEPVMFERLPAMDKPLDGAYLDEIAESHIFVIILWKDITEAVEKEYIKAVGCGIPILLLVKSPTFRESRTPKLETFLGGTMGQDSNVKTQYVPFRKKFRSLSEFESELKAGLMALISDRFTEQALTTTNNEVSARATLSMVQNAKRVLLFVAKTPIILFEPRPYFSELKNYVEDNFYKALTSWIDEIRNNENRRMLYLYSVKDTFHEMNESKLQQIVIKNLAKYKKIEEETCGRFELGSTQEFPGRIIVSDNSFGIQFRAPKEKTVCVFRQDAGIASNLMELMCEYRGDSNKSLDTLLKELKLV